MQRVASKCITALLIAVFAIAVIPLWGAWEIAYIQKDSFGYLAPVARRVFEDGWDHIYGRPFVYPALVSEVIRLAGSLNAVIAGQIALYMAGAIALYLAVRTPALAATTSASPDLDLLSRFIATAMVTLYFGLSNDYMSSAFYLIPEIVCSVLSIIGLLCALRLAVVDDLSKAQTYALVLTTSACAALLVGLKPSFLAVSLLFVFLSVLATLRKGLRSNPLQTLVVLSAALALPATVLLIDSSLAKKHGDTDAILFGPRTAFCNNANIMLPYLESLDSRSSEILGPDGVQQTVSFLNVVVADKTRWPLLGFYGDYCIYNLGARRQELERSYFGDTPERVASTYRRLLLAAIASNPLLYMQRIGRQFGAFLWVVPGVVPVDCMQQTRAEAGPGAPLVERLVRERSSLQTSVYLPSAPLSPLVCPLFEWTLGAIRAGVLFIVVVAFISRRTAGASSSNFMQLHERGLALALLAWFASGAVVAAVHTFDVYRYVSVTLPLLLAMLGVATVYLGGWVLGRHKGKAGDSGAA